MATGIRPIMTRKYAMQVRGWMAASAVAVLVLGGWAAMRAYQGGGVVLSDAAHAGGPGGWVVQDGAPGGNAGGVNGSKALTPDQVRTRLFKDGSFAGTEPSGDWCVVSGKLSPCPELRKRFEYYILGLGEVTIEDIKALVADEARRAHGDQAAADIMGIWDKYWQIRTHEWRNKFDQSNRATWLPVFEEQRMVRRQILGDEWAKAFYEQDEQNFKQYYAQLESGQPPPPDPGEPVPQMAPGKDPAAVYAERVARYGQAAADRLTKADDEWADWERRLSAARQEWARLQAASNLSDTQRKQDMTTYINSHFKSDEYLRVQALLHL
jgi:lipase chaperone LimK